MTQAVADRHTDGQMDGQTQCDNKLIISLACMSQANRTHTQKLADGSSAVPRLLLLRCHRQTSWERGTPRAADLVLSACSAHLAGMHAATNTLSLNRSADVFNVNYSNSKRINYVHNFCTLCHLLSEQ